jgi:CRP-like cAMP-binding protein
MNALAKLLSTHPVFKDLKPEYITFLSESACEHTFKAGKVIFKTGEPAEEFYLIKEGKVALEVYSPPKGSLNILTLNSNSVLGWSWLYPPYTWHFEARAISDTTTFTFDAIKVRTECRRDFEFGYMFTNCFGQIMMRRLVATRLQLLDVFGTDPENSHHHD